MLKFLEAVLRTLEAVLRTREAVLRVLVGGAKGPGGRCLRMGLMGWDQRV